MNKFILIFILIITLQIFLLTPSGYAEYPTLLKNKFFDEVGSNGDGQGKVNKNDTGEKEKPFTLDQNRFLMSVSVGFDEGFNYQDSYNNFTFRKSGFSPKLLIDYWFNDVFAFGFETGGLYFSQYKEYSDYVYSSEYNFFIMPNIKIGIPYISNWRLFLLLGGGLYLNYYDGRSASDTGYLLNIGFGGHIAITDHYELGLIIENMFAKVGSYDLAQDLYILSISPYIGYIF